MGDAEAHMLLATCNSQGELSPLEIGIHALQAVGKGSAGRGKKGGLSEYAKLLGKSKQYMAQLVAAAEVAKSTTQVVDLATLRDKAKHLYAIHDLPQELWAGAVETLGERSVVEVEAAVKKAKEFLQQHGITREWVDYLPPSECALAVFADADPNKFNRLNALAGKVFADLPEDLATEWRTWLVENRGGDSWDIALCQKKRVELEDRQYAREDSHCGRPAFVG